MGRAGNCSIYPRSCCLRIMLKTLNPHSQAVCTQAWKYLGAAKSHGIETMKHCKGDESEQGALYPLAMAEIR